MEEKIDAEITSHDNIAIVRFRTACISGVEAIASLARQIKVFVTENRPRLLIVDFTGVKFFSSQVLGMLLDVRASLQACDGQLVMSAIDPQLHRVFKITNLDKIFRFFPDNESAISSATAENTD